MAETLDPSDIVVPDADGEESISRVGVAELRRVGAGANTAIARMLSDLAGKADAAALDTAVDALDTALDEVIADLAGKMDVEAVELSGQDANTLTTPGVYYESVSAEAGPNYPEQTAGVFTVTASPGRNHVHQQFLSFGTSNPRQWYRSRYSGTWGEWRQIVTGDMLDGKVDELIGQVHEPVELGTRDLNDVTDPGFYTQDFSADATVARHYPEDAPRAGRLLVQTNTLRTQVTQQFITYDANEYLTWFVRNFYLEWGEWQTVTLSGGGGDTGGGFSDAELGTVNLDTVTDPGTYSQQFSAQASLELGYPQPRAGRLLVQANESRSQVSQMYVTFDTTSNVGFYLRNYYSGWSEWWEIPLGGSGGGGGAGGFALHGVVENGTDVSELTEPGVYSVSTVSAANSLVDWPTNRGGILIVGANPDAGVTSQQVIAHVSSSAAPEQYTRTKLLASTATWGPWSSPEWVKGRLPEGTNADEWRMLGAWMVVNASDATGLPGSGQGLLEIAYLTGAGISLQRFTERVANDDVVVWHRYSLLVGGWAGIEWSRVGGSGGDGGGSAGTSDVQVSDHATRVEIAASRRGGGIGTGGQPVFMWRFDHWLVAFRDKILPILREFDLPATLNVNYDNLDNPQNGGGSITWADVQDWNQFDGIEIANHGATHTNASTRDAIYHEVVDGRRLLEAAMPRVAVETWQEHGSAYLQASDIPGDPGLDIGREPHNFTESYAGRLIMAEHAVVEGKFGSFYPPVTGRPQIGQSHYSLDRHTAASSIETIQYAQRVGRGLTGYTHPGLMDMVNIDGSLYPATYREDGTVRLDYPSEAQPGEFNTEADLRSYVDTLDGIVHMSVRDFRETCRWIAAERDADRLMVMTAAGGGFADKRSNHRENLLVPELAEWSYTSGWTETGEGAARVWASDASAIRLTQGMLLYTRFGWAMGAAHELLVYAKADVETTLMLRLEKMGDAGTWATQKEHTVPGDGVLRPYRLPLTLPRDRSITSMTCYVGGPSMEIHGAPVLAAI